MDAGLVCEKCGGRRLPTLWTRRRGQVLIRVRICRACKTRVRTEEARKGQTGQSTGPVTS